MGNRIWRMGSGLFAGGLLFLATFGTLAISLEGCSRDVSSVQDSGHRNLPAEQSSLPAPPDQERSLTFDWDDQLKGPADGKGYVDVNTLIKIPARVEKTTWPLFDVGGVGGRRDRTAVFSLLNGQHIPQHPQSSHVTLTTTEAGLTRLFLVEGKIYTIVFTPDGHLYDVVDEQGRSGQNDKEKW